LLRACSLLWALLVSHDPDEREQPLVHVLSAPIVPHSLYTLTCLCLTPKYAFLNESSSFAFVALYSHNNKSCGLVHKSTKVYPRTQLAQVCMHMTQNANGAGRSWWMWDSAHLAKCTRFTGLHAFGLQEIVRRYRASANQSTPSKIS
jgi:hypothetical protein